MSELAERCTVCRALLDEEDLFCANCGTEAPNRDQQDAAGTTTSTHNFQCSGCGASMSYDASAQTLRCPFCGSAKLNEQNDTKVVKPQWVVPFEINHNEADAIMRKWLGSSFWRPSDLAKTAVVTKMTSVYVPYWIFSARTFTYWTADTSHTPLGARGDWYPIAGHHRGQHAGLLVGASGALHPAETSALCPYDLQRAVSPDNVDLDNVVVEQFRVQRKYARPQAHEGIEQLERQSCTRYVPGRARNVKVNVRMEGLSSVPVLVPVWIMAYRYRDKVFRFLINGQTGRSTGQAPTSWRKVLLIIGIVLAILLFFVFVVCAGVGLASATSKNNGTLTRQIANAAIDEPISVSDAMNGASCFHRTSAILSGARTNQANTVQSRWPANGSSAAITPAKRRTATCARNACRRWSASVT